MKISSSENGGKVRLAITGIIDEKGAEELKAHFKSFAITAETEVVIDFRQVKQIGSSGIGKLLLLYKNLRMQGGRLAVVNLPDPIHDLFQELKLDTLFSISKTGG